MAVRPDPTQMRSSGALAEPVLPVYGGACITGLVPALLGGCAASWLPDPLRGATQVVLLALDGLGWDQLQERRELAPFMTSMAGHPITSVVPTTTATALTSLTTGLAPNEHEVVGYRVRAGGDVLNVLRWRTHGGGDARESYPPAEFQTHPAFGGRIVPVVTRAEFAGSGFSQAHLAGGTLHGWRMPSTLIGHVGMLLDAGEPFVYAYYDGLDKVAHEFGFGRYYDAELVTADRLVRDLAGALPAGAALVLTSDHGQVEVGDAVVPLPPALLADVAMLSGEGRFRWLHARPGTSVRLAAAAVEAFGEIAWVRTVDELEADGWYGGRLSDVSRSRLGDVALIPHAPIAFLDPGDTGETRLRCRHGSVTAAEMFVPLLAYRADMGQHAGRA